jgi:hypothetical protein
MKIKFKNIAGSIESFMQNSATVVCTWIFPNKDGTVAMLDDVAAAQSNAQGYADTKVEDAINNGTTTKAPSENAVFDALAAKQNSLGFTPEDVANKDTDSTMTANSDAKYASQKAVKTALATKQDSIGFTPENVANKATDFTTINNTKYPTVKAVDDSFAARRGAVNGLASLDGSGKVPSAQIPETHFRGYYTSLVALQTAIPTGNNGDYATVDTGVGSAAINYIWDAQDGWVQQSGAGAGVTSFNSRTGPVTSANGDYTASQVTNVPAGNIAGVTVQAALNELDTEKQAVSAKDASGGYAGLTLFKINFKNVANTFISFFTNSNTAARTYTFQDRDGTIADNTDLAAKVDETDFVTLTDGATVTWDTSNGAGAGNGLQSPLAKVTLAGTTRTLAMTNLKSGASGLLVITTGVAGAITLTFPAGSVDDNGALAPYTFPAGSGKAYDLTFWYYSGTSTIKWIIGVNNIDTDPTFSANSDQLVPSQKAVATAMAAKESTANKDASNGYVGLTLLKINFKNVLNTFTSFFTNSNTGARTYTFQDRNGTIADLTDIQTALDYTDSVSQYNPWKNIVDAATTAALPTNTIDGAYQIITASANGVLTIDGQTGMTKVLIMHEADQKKNGKFDVIAPGVAGVSPFQLRRSTDFDASNKIRAAVIRVLNGTVNAGKFFKQDTASITIGTSNIIFSEFGVPAAGLQDLYVPANAMWPRLTGGCGLLTQSEMATSVVNIQTLDFDQTTQEFAQFTIALPRNWNNGTVTFKVYWTAISGSGGVVWGFKGGAYSDADVLTTALGTEQVIADTFLAANQVHISGSTPALTLAGSPQDADFLAFQISRNPADASDTLNADAKLLGVVVTLTTDSGTAA